MVETDRSMLEWKEGATSPSQCNEMYEGMAQEILLFQD